MFCVPPRKKNAFTSKTFVFFVKECNVSWGTETLVRMQNVPLILGVSYG